MTGDRARTLVFALAAWASISGCTEAPAGESPERWEYGVFLYVGITSEKGDQLRYTWATADSELSGQSVGELWTGIGIKAANVGEHADRMRILNHLTAQGWELVSDSSVGTAIPGGIGVAQRDLFRRRK
ncbi:MAG: hypothetical protein ACYSX0_06550 [Planctomycetota bacterium]|jgi:hypothetical protein